MSDIDDILARLSDDIVINSPITDTALTRGKDQAKTLLTAVLSNLRNRQVIDYSTPTETSPDQLVVWTATTPNGAAIEVMERQALNSEHLVSRIDISVRPLSGLAEVMGIATEALAHSGGKRLAWLAWTSATEQLARLGDALAEDRAK